MHALYEADDRCLGILEALELEHALLVRCTAPELVTGGRTAKNHAFVTLEEHKGFVLDQSIQVLAQLGPQDTNVVTAPTKDGGLPLGVAQAGKPDVVEHVEVHVFHRLALRAYYASGIAKAHFIRWITDDELTVKPLEVLELLLNVNVRNRLVAPRVHHAVAHGRADTIELRTGI